MGFFIKTAATFISFKLRLMNKLFFLTSTKNLEAVPWYNLYRVKRNNLYRGSRIMTFKTFFWQHGYSCTIQDMLSGHQNRLDSFKKPGKMIFPSGYTNGKFSVRFWCSEIYLIISYEIIWWLVRELVVFKLLWDLYLV